MWGFAGCQLCVALDRNGDWVFSEKNFWVGFVFEACLHTLTSPHHLAKGGEGVARLAKRARTLVRERGGGACPSTSGLQPRGCRTSRDCKPFDSSSRYLSFSSPKNTSEPASDLQAIICGVTQLIRLRRKPVADRLRITGNESEE